MLPDAFYSCDGMFETFLTILDQMDAYPAVIAKENTHYLPFLMTTTIMMEAVKAGVGRETAHKAIKEHAIGTVTDLREGRVERNDLVSRLASDERLPLDQQQLQQIVALGAANAGAAASQIRHFVEQVVKLTTANPKAADYMPGSIL
jgi:adenylosuccinate lyase